MSSIDLAFPDSLVVILVLIGIIPIAVVLFLGALLTRVMLEGQADYRAVCRWSIWQIAALALVLPVATWFFFIFLGRTAGNDDSVVFGSLCQLPVLNFIISAGVMTVILSQPPEPE